MGRQAAAAQRLIAISPDDGSAIDLRNPWLAAFLSWLVPGLGHLYQGRVFKGGLFLVAILAGLVFGLWIGGGRVVYAEWRPGEPRLAFIGQAGIGGVAIPAVLQTLRLNGPARQPYFASPLFAPPLRPGQMVSPVYAARLARSDPGMGPDDFFDHPPFKQCRREQLSVWQRRLARRFELGTLYTVVAGMLNVLVVLDALAGPLRTPSAAARESSPDPVRGPQRDARQTEKER